MKKIITKTSEEARREREREEERRRIFKEKHTCPECNNYDTRNLVNKYNNTYRCNKCGCEWRIEEENKEKGLTGPVKPLGVQWIGVNFESQGICPNCGNLVVDGYQRTDHNCPNCGIELIWRD